MGSLVADLDLDVSPVQRSKEENQERAFVAASRRKDRSLDARLESANRASMLHKKRTGKALHITKEIVEKEAMYEEVDERYQEKRLSILKAHTTQLEAQFHRHLMATMAMNNNARHQQHQARISPNGGIQKMRNSSVGSASDYFGQLNSNNLHIQAAAPVSPTTSSSNVPSPTSPVIDMYGNTSSSSSDTSSFAQTPASGCFVSTPMACPQYVDTGLMSPSVSPRNSTYQQCLLNPMQSVHMRSASTAQVTTPAPAPYPRQRFASYPDAFMLQTPQEVVPQLSAASYVNFRASSEPSSDLLATPSPTGPLMTTTVQENGLLPSPALSPPSMTVGSSQDTSCDNTQYSTQAAAAPPPPPAQVQFNDTELFKQQPLLGSSEDPDPDFNEFVNFATNMEDQWQYAMGGNAPFEEFMNLENLDCELAHSGLYR
ncbi:conserved hypothetical protein [Talaromyces stipitatus ATCC 10500]|uniref:Uncharacterized protein n=1 Tax=Talaromyces stipitatus (strain ATCC 10500 / CBS 375.48 / QM 6759 / NRRL 1006) TaxID=441959 RepID=B8LUL0_TALSN|nr:uncharacterized protein TSTA_072580 [Talaromyces stipitatus ATCC 10500]EED23867.1 conserved hypothetical protein [Talaromyces stipitatus ATCC 10500]